MAVSYFFSLVQVLESYRSTFLLLDFFHHGLGFKGHNVRCSFEVNKFLRKKNNKGPDRGLENGPEK